MNNERAVSCIGGFGLLVTLCLLLGSSESWGQTTFTINSTTDRANSNPGNGVCFTGVQISIGGFLEAECTLRAAIEEANQATGTVTFNISSGIAINDPNLQVSIIRVQTGLPFINRRIILAGETHPLFDAENNRPRLYVNYEGTETGVSGLRFSTLGGGSGSTIRHIGITSFPNSGILLQGGNGFSISNNVIGIQWRSSGMSQLGNGSHGIDMNNASASGSGNVSLISRNIVLSNGGDGIRLRNGTAAAVVVGNVIGLVPPFDGQSTWQPIEDWGNVGAGIFVADSAGTGSIIGDFFSGPNTVSNNGTGGLHIMADGQNILGNHIGVPVGGLVHPGFSLSDYGNDSNGIIVESSNNVIGGSGAATNIIGNSQFVGIRLGSGGGNIEANDNQIRRNLIGVMPDGRAAGQSQGIRIDNGSGNTIIGAEITNNITGIEFRSGGNSASRNTIVNNAASGVWFRAGGTLGGLDLADANVIGLNGRGVDITSEGGFVEIINNYIGTNADGDNLGNVSVGISVNSTGTIDIGQPGRGNVIGYNSTASGIQLTNAVSTWITGNHIGVHRNGQPAPNGWGILIGTVDSTTTDNRIGYGPTATIPTNPLAGSGNIIAHNSNHGVNIDERSGATQLRNVIRGNSIFSNGGQGIYLGPNGGTIDEGGGSTGPNRLQNFPVFDDQATFYDSNTNTLNFRYQVRTLAVNATYPLRIDFYLAASGANQGRTYLGTHVYQASDALGFVVGTLTPPAGTSMFGNLTATATDAAGNTSQFTTWPVSLGEQQDSIFADRFRN